MTYPRIFMIRNYKDKEKNIQRGVLNGTIPSVVSDTVAILRCAPVNAPLQKWESVQTRC